MIERAQCQRESHELDGDPETRIGHLDAVEDIDDRFPARFWIVHGSKRPSAAQRL